MKHSSCIPGCYVSICNGRRRRVDLVTDCYMLWDAIDVVDVNADFIRFADW